MQVQAANWVLWYEEHLRFELSGLKDQLEQKVMLPVEGLDLRALYFGSGAW